jgi:hypothetical protein
MFEFEFATGIALDFADFPVRSSMVTIIELHDGKLHSVPMTFRTIIGKVPQAGLSRALARYFVGGATISLD